jgi:hypothetical protein
MKAIVFSSNTGFTEEYAKMLSEKLDIPAFSLEDAKNKLDKGCEVIFMSWLMAGSVFDYKKAKKLFDIKTVCAVGLCETGTLVEETRKTSKIPQETAVFTLQGGYRPEKLKGIYKFIMSIVVKALIKKIDGMENKKESDLKMKETLINGGSYVCEENLSSVIEHLK